jgi:3-methyl-2-oxobutanoate hydroxymethyltransferase
MKITAENLIARKKHGPKIVMLTSYDYPTAIIEDNCCVDIQLIGDSVGTNVLGYTDVSQVTVDDMLHHTKAVARGVKRSFILCDMPYRSFATAELAIDNARRFLDGGADGVKIEGEQESLDQIGMVAAAGIPVCAHIGYTPQTDGAKAVVQGKNLQRAQELVSVALKLEQAGAFMIVLELIPRQLTAEITRLLRIPTIGIGAGPFCDGQVQVIHDITGLSSRIFRHAKTYGETGREFSRIITAYADDVHAGNFPASENSANLPDDTLHSIQAWIKTLHEAGDA